MAKKIAPLLPSTTSLLQLFGERLRMARLRRRLTAKQVAARSGMAPMTLRSLERGGAGVTIGAYLAVMQVLGIEKDLDLLGAADPLGRELQDTRMTARGKPLIRAKLPVPGNGVKRVRAMPDKSEPRDRKNDGNWVKKSGFASARNLVDLIDLDGAAPKKKR